MLLIAADMQRHLLNPLERMTKIMKILTGRKWRKKFAQVRDGKAESAHAHCPPPDGFPPQPAARIRIPQPRK